MTSFRYGKDRAIPGHGLGARNVEWSPFSRRISILFIVVGLEIQASWGARGLHWSFSPYEKHAEDARQQKALGAHPLSCTLRRTSGPPCPPSNDMYLHYCPLGVGSTPSGGNPVQRSCPWSPQSVETLLRGEFHPPLPSEKKAIDGRVVDMAAHWQTHTCLDIIDYQSGVLVVVHLSHFQGNDVIGGVGNMPHRLTFGAHGMVVTLSDTRHRHRYTLFLLSLSVCVSEIDR